MVDEAKERTDSKEISVGIPSEVSEILSDAMLPFLTQQEFLTYSRVSTSGAQLRVDKNLWAMRIENEFKHHVSETKSKSLLLPNHLIYQHLKIYNEIDSSFYNRHLRFTSDDPAIFQRALSEEITQERVLKKYLYKAARVGNFELVQWLISPARKALRIYPDNITLNSAIKSGNLALIQWLMKENPRLEPDEYVVRQAAGKGYMELVLWFMHEDRHQQRVVFRDPQFLLEWVAHSGKIEFVQWFIAKERGEARLTPTPKMLTEAARRNRRELVEWLMDEQRGSQRVNPNSETLNAAAEGGNLSLVQWFMSEERGTQRVQINWNTLYFAASSGNLDLVLWLVKQGAMPNIASLNGAARSGNLDLVKWHRSPAGGNLQEHPQAQILTLILTARYGHLETMAWLVHADRGWERLLPTRETLNEALKYGQLNIVQFLMTAQGEEPAINPDPDTLRLAIEFHHLALVQWLVDADRGEQRIIPTNISLHQAISARDLEIIQWLMAPERGAQRISPELDDLNHAVTVGDLEIIEWLMADERGSQQVNPDHSTLDRAVFFRHAEVVKWLVAPARGRQQVLPNLEELEESLEEARLWGRHDLVDWLQTFSNTDSTIGKEQNELKISAPLRKEQNELKTSPLRIESPVITISEIPDESKTPDEKVIPRLQGGVVHKPIQQTAPDPILTIPDGNNISQPDRENHAAVQPITSILFNFFKNPYFRRMVLGSLSGLAASAIIYIGFMAAAETELFNPIGDVEGSLGMGAGIGFMIGILAIAQKYYSDNLEHREQPVPVGSVRG